jgi:hypothetical protein
MGLYASRKLCMCEIIVYGYFAWITQHNLSTAMADLR